MDSYNYRIYIIGDDPMLNRNFTPSISKVPDIHNVTIYRFLWHCAVGNQIACDHKMFNSFLHLLNILFRTSTLLAITVTCLLPTKCCK